MAIQIPPEHLSTIAKICALPEIAVEELIAALGSTHLEAEATEMAALIAEYVPDIPTEDLKGIVDTVYALYAVREFSEVEYDRFLADLVADIVRHTDFKDSLSVTIRFDKLLSIEKKTEYAVESY